MRKKSIKINATDDSVFELKNFNKAILESAAEHHAAGLATHWLKPASKAPLDSGWSSAPVLSLDELNQKHQPGFNLGFRAGKFSKVKGFSVVVLDVDIKHPDFADEAYAVVKQIMGYDINFTVNTGSIYGRHQYLRVPTDRIPDKAAITLRQSDVAVKDGKVVPLGTEGSKPAWTIELLSTGKNVVMPPSLHPDTRQQYQWANGKNMGELTMIPESILELLDSKSGDDWPVPEAIKFELLPVAKFTPELLPYVVLDFVYDIAERTQCPVDFVAVVVIQMLCVVIGNSCGIRPKQLDDWQEYANLWVAVIGRPGQLKTPAKNKGSEPLRWLEADAQQAYEAELTFFEHDKIDKELEIQRLKNIKNRTADQQEELSALLKEKPVEPNLRRYRTSDATVEKIAELLNFNPRGILVERDELMGLLATFIKPGHESDRSFYLEAWNGNGKYVVDRISRGTTIVENMAISVYGSIQPAKLQSYLHQAQYGLGNDGLLQRFQLMVYPDDNRAWTINDREPNRQAAEAVVALARKLAVNDWVKLGAQTEENRPKPFFRFDLEAQQVFNDWYIALGQKVNNEDFGLVAEHLGKYRKLLPALALVMHLVDLCTEAVPVGTSVTVAALNRAIAWADYLETHARRVYHMAIDVREDAVKSLSAKLSSGELTDGFTERDVYRKQWSNLGDPELVAAACNELEIAGWIRRMKHDRHRSGRTTVRYEINPAVIGDQ